MFFEVSKQDWKLFRERIVSWQEAYMERLAQEYIAILSGDASGSEKWWALEKRIKQDRKSPGVIVELRKSEVPWILRELLYEQAITPDDLEGFSDELTERVLWLHRNDLKSDLESDPEEKETEEIG